MRRILAIIASIVLSIPAFCQGDLDAVRAKMREGRVSFSYELSSEGKLPFSASGKVVVQAERYICQMQDGGKIWCDGKTRWTLDRESREIYIEDVASSPDILSGIELYLPYVKDLSVSKDGKAVSATYDDGKLRIGIKINSIANLPAVGADSGYFSPDIAKYSDSGWTISDLR